MWTVDLGLDHGKLRDEVVNKEEPQGEGRMILFYSIDCYKSSVEAATGS